MGRMLTKAICPHTFFVAEKIQVVYGMKLH